ncbi:adapitin protein [Klebsormidium nitens]|uniref:AP-2 complex subunit alpha n=1 Tax=Klebsormidium nitens TaxID=105231 RepID=A0A1Y1IVQ0_KLENI|nr:adapitin protein [Klebsormidium nitens]|eukprot:GAQ92348.1 adapitin protein [Klebsormidium nitens]
MATSGMRGLSTFIADIRNCQNKEAEKARVEKELANIRSKIKAAGMTGYEKKKYVWKMLYIYMLGYDVEYGQTEAIALMSAPKYAEKQVGYIVTAALLNETVQELRLVINTVRNDIISRNEIFQCLGLTFVANVGGTEFAESLAADVQQLLLSRTARPLVRKKAALCLLRLYRKNRDVINVDGWGDVLGPLLDERDIGVLTAVMSLLLALVAASPEAYLACVPKCVRLLERLTRSVDVPQEYTYYGIPSPWLQVKTMRVLQYFPALEDPGQRRGLLEVLQRVLMGTDVVKNVNKNNAAHAVLFEALALVLHMDVDRDLMTQCVALLGKFIAVREPNIRYLGLENMARLAAVADMNAAIKRHQAHIIASLKDPDISIRRRALDLLYGMCDTSNAKDIVEELLKFMASADFGLREELALKAAILAEKYAPDLGWYVDVILQLVEKAGDFVSDDIWYRVVQIVTNNDDLQAYAASKGLAYLRASAVHETMIKVGAYLLGEYGHLLARQPGSSPADIFAALHHHFHSASVPTKSLLLTAYIKLLLHAPPDPALRDQVLAVFTKYGSALDAEVQQRAVEYFALASRGPGMADIVAEMPKFPERASALEKRVVDSAGDTTEISAAARRAVDSSAVVLAPGAVPAQPGQPAPLRGPGPGAAPSAGPTAAPGRQEYVAPWAAGGAAPVANGHAPSGADLLGDLLAPDAPPAGGPPSDPLASAQGAAAAAVEPVGSVAEWFSKLCVADSGVLYEDPFLQIGVKQQYAGPQGRLLLFFGNKHTAPLTALHATISAPPGCASPPAPPPDTLPPRAQLQMAIECVCAAPFPAPASLALSYSAGVQPVAVQLHLPAVLSKFLQPVPVTADSFFAKWKQFLNPPNRIQEIVRNVKPIGLQGIAAAFIALKIGLAQGLDPNPNNLVAASSLATENNGANAVCMVRVETDPADRTQLRLTVACSNPTATQALRQIIVDAVTEPTLALPAPPPPAGNPLAGLF